MNKIGDIFINKYAGHIDCRYFIYLGINGRNVIGLSYVRGKGWEKTKYDKYMFNKVDERFNEIMFEKVGHTNFLEIAKKDLEILKGDSNE